MNAPATDVVWDEASHGWTWLEIVRRAVADLGGKDVPLRAIYGLVERHPKVVGKKHWRERIRATIERSAEFVRTGRGCWSLSKLFAQEERAEFERIRRERYPLLGPRERQS